MNKLTVNSVGAIKSRGFRLSLAVLSVSVLMMGCALHSGQSREKSHPTNALSQYTMGKDYANGKSGHKLNDALSEYWFLQSAKQGYIPAEYQVGHDYLWGIGVYHNKKEAAIWLKKAAKAGYTPAKYDLAVDYGLPKGLYWLKSAANDHYQEAEVLLAKSYQRLFIPYPTWKLPPENDVKAYKWWKRAALQHNAEAEYYLAEDDYKGIGTPQNSLSAIKWWNIFLRQTAYHPKSLWYGLTHPEGSGEYPDKRNNARYGIKQAERGCFWG